MRGRCDNAYVSASTAREHGEILVVRGRMPDVADTYFGDQQMEGDAQMRYWSMCHAAAGATGPALNAAQVGSERPLHRPGFSGD